MVRCPGPGGRGTWPGRRSGARGSTTTCRQAFRGVRRSPDSASDRAQGATGLRRAPCEGRRASEDRLSPGQGQFEARCCPLCRIGAAGTRRRGRDPRVIRRIPPCPDAERDQRVDPAAHRRGRMGGVTKRTRRSPKVPVGHDIRSVASRGTAPMVEQATRRAACCRKKDDDIIAARGSSEHSLSRAG